MSPTKPDPENLNTPSPGELWLQLSFAVFDLARALRQAGFLEAFVEQAILEFIRVNPLAQSRPTPEVYVLSDAENDELQQAGRTTEGRE